MKVKAVPFTLMLDFINTPFCSGVFALNQASPHVIDFWQKGKRRSE
jgi:hypothetical protein